MKQLVLAEGPDNQALVVEEALVIEAALVVEGPDFHYLTRVRRLEPGDRIFALRGSTRLSLELEAVTATQAHFRVLAKAPVDRSGCQLTLFPFLLKGGKLDDVIRQACEAGVSRVVPIQGDHCVSRVEAADEAKKLLRWKQIARQAAQQSGNSTVCEVLPPLSSAALAVWWDKSGPLLLFHQVELSGPLAKAGLHRYLADTPEGVGLVIGPEGGLSEAEVAGLLAAGALPVWLGPAVLRAETASLHAVAAVNIILQERSQWSINNLPVSPA